MGRARRGVISKKNVFPPCQSPFSPIYDTPTPGRTGVKRGAIAQLVERLNGIQEVVGSIPIGSTIFLLKSEIFSGIDLSVLSARLP